MMYKESARIVYFITEKFPFIISERSVDFESKHIFSNICSIIIESTPFRVQWSLNRQIVFQFKPSSRCEVFGRKPNYKSRKGFHAVGSGFEVNQYVIDIYLFLQIFFLRSFMHQGEEEISYHLQTTQFVNFNLLSNTPDWIGRNTTD